MSDLKVYVLPGDPVPLLRARFSKYSGSVYNSQKTRQIVDQINLQEQHSGQSYFEGQLQVHITFFMPIPQTMSMKRKAIMPGRYHTSKPDIDNLLKYYLDISTSVLFKNDAIISKVTAQKVYDINPRTEFTVSNIL